jgi:hypothetical protein
VDGHQQDDMWFWNRAGRSNVEPRYTPHGSLILTVILIQIVGRTCPKAQYPLPPGQIPPYGVQYPDPGVAVQPNGYEDEGNRRLENHVSRISGQDLRSLLQRADFMLSNECTKNVAAQWQFETNVNAATQQAAVSLLSVSTDYMCGLLWQNIIR